MRGGTQSMKGSLPTPRQLCLFLLGRSSRQVKCGYRWNVEVSKREGPGIKLLQDGFGQEGRCEAPSAKRMPSAQDIELMGKHTGVTVDLHALASAHGDPSKDPRARRLISDAQNMQPASRYDRCWLKRLSDNCQLNLSNLHSVWVEN